MRKKILNLRCFFFVRVIKSWKRHRKKISNLLSSMEFFFRSYKMLCHGDLLKSSAICRCWISKSKSKLKQIANCLQPKCAHSRIYLKTSHDILSSNHKKYSAEIVPSLQRKDWMDNYRETRTHSYDPLELFNISHSRLMFPKKKSFDFVAFAIPHCQRVRVSWKVKLEPDEFARSRLRVSDSRDFPYLSVCTFFAVQLHHILRLIKFTRVSMLVIESEYM